MKQVDIHHSYEKSQLFVKQSETEFQEALSLVQALQGKFEKIDNFKNSDIVSTMK
jgi:hypothetical protein